MGKIDKLAWIARLKKSGMGVRNLRRRLEPYGDSAELKGRSFVIDGPALAYHVIRLCERQMKRKNSPWETPSYQLLGETTLAWLDQVQVHGNNVSRIFFDGFLPASKEPVRFDRLVQSTRKLQAYANTFRGALPHPPHDEPPVVVTDLFHLDRFGDKTLVAAPPPAFAVPAVIEALRSSAYGPVTTVVQGEADLFCAGYTKSHGGTVLTSDSDLLVHDLGQEGSVVFLDNVQLIADEVPVLKATEWKGSAVRERLSVDNHSDLVKFAFELRLSPTVKPAQALQMSKKRLADADLKRFSDQFDSCDLGQEHVNEVIPLDPRVSELVLRWSMIRSDLGLTDQRKEINMFLPFLLDDIMSSSAWAFSSPIRSLAYGTLRVSGDNKQYTVKEFRRMLTAPYGGVPVDPPNSREMSQEAFRIQKTLRKIREAVSDPSLVWPMFTVYLDIVMSAEIGTGGDGMPLSLKVLSAQGMQPDWQFVHFSARLQATYYSFRMIQQIYDFVSHQYGFANMPASMKELRASISTLPLLVDFPTLQNTAGLMNRMRESGKLAALATIPGLPDGTAKKIEACLRPDLTDILPPRKKRKVRVAKHKVERRDSAHPTNLFELLSNE